MTSPTNASLNANLNACHSPSSSNLRMVKEKKKAPAVAKGDDAEQMVLEYLRKTNRPYSATDVFNNLHGAVSKTVMQKVLNSLTEHENISSKTYNKQTVYVVKQASASRCLNDQFETPSENELSEMDQKIETLKAAVAELKDANKQLQSTLSGLNQSLTKEQIRERLKALSDENAKYEERLATLRSGTKQISVDEKKKIDNEYEANRKLWRKRKRMFNEIFGTITENMQQNPKEFAEEIGIEQDSVDINVDPLASL